MLRSVPIGMPAWMRHGDPAGTGRMLELPMIALRRDMDPSGLFEELDDGAAVHVENIHTNRRHGKRRVYLCVYISEI